MSDEEKPVHGEFNTFYGNIDPEVMKRLGGGRGNTVVGATDSRGNTIITTPMSVGFAASGGPGSIALGAFAGGRGSDLEKIVEELENGQLRLDSAFVKVGVSTDLASEVSAFAVTEDEPTALARLRTWATEKLTDPQQVVAMTELGTKLFQAFWKASAD
ncbi:hypothetical protein [Neorhizobium sp. DAR64861/K0K2]|uniref:hypothetical protein n=1 Tax=unclassified Neorhizobium TaxID=2629175 RepID=UPI003D2D1353